MNKRRWLQIFLLLLGVVVALGAGVYFFFPQVMLDAVRSSYEREAGVVEKKVVIDGYPSSYYEGGKGQTVVLIHGFGDSKISFLQMVRWLTPRYRVILPEVPGFGETPQRKTHNYGIRSQVVYLHKLFLKLGLKSFHLGGNSMGGHISAAYTLSHPKYVKSLFLIDAAGLKATQKTPYRETGKKNMTRADFQAFLRKIFYKVPSIPRPVESYLVQKAINSYEWNNHLRRDIIKGKDYLLNDRISQVRKPTLVLWGDSDRVVNIKVGQLFKKLIPGAKMKVMVKCGHSPQYERPKETSDIYLGFLRGIKTP